MAETRKILEDALGIVLKNKELDINIIVSKFGVVSAVTAMTGTEVIPKDGKLIYTFSGSKYANYLIDYCDGDVSGTAKSIVHKDIPAGISLQELEKSYPATYSKLVEEARGGVMEEEAARFDELTELIESEVTAAKVTSLRELMGLTQSQLADKAGLSKNTVWRIENTQGRTEFNTLRAIAKALGCKIEELA